MRRAPLLFPLVIVGLFGISLGGCDEGGGTPSVECTGSGTVSACATSTVGPACVSNSCGCTSSAECVDHIPAAGDICGADGSCVECTTDDSSACAPDTTCNLLGRSCTGPRAGTQDPCSTCSNDSQCEEWVDPFSGDRFPQRCVSFPSGRADTPTGFRCLPLYLDPASGGNGCPKPFFRITGSDFASLSSLPGDGALHEFCGFNREMTSCEAIRATVIGTPCTPDTEGRDATACGAAGLCRSIGGGNVCTYACGTAFQCPDHPNFRSCGNAGTGGTGQLYCGGGAAALSGATAEVAE